MHACEGDGRRVCEALEQPAGVRRVRIVVHCDPRGFTGLEDVILRDCRMYLSELREQIAAEQGARCDLVEEPALPSVRQMRCIDPLHRMLSERKALLISQCPRRAVGQIPNRHHCCDLAAERYSPWRDSKELIERSALVGLDVRERDIPKRRHRDDALDGLTYGLEQHSRTGVEQ